MPGLVRGVVALAALAIAPAFAGRDASGRSAVAPTAAASQRSAGDSLKAAKSPAPNPKDSARDSVAASPVRATPPAASTAPAAAPILPVPAAPVQAKPGSPGFKAAVDSLLKKDAADSAEETAEDEEGDSLGAKPGLAFILKKPSRKDVKEFQAATLKAVTAMHKGDPAKAAAILVKTNPTERLAQVYRAIMLSEAWQEAGDFVRADSILQATLDWVGGSVWQNYLLNRRIEVFPNTNPTDSARLRFYSRVIGTQVARAVKVNFLYELLRIQGFTGPAQGHEELLKRVAAIAPADKRLDTLHQALAGSVSFDPSNWEMQNVLLDMESKLGQYDIAMRRAEEMLKLVPGKPEKQKLHWTYAGLQFKARNYKQAIPLFEKYLERYGDDADAMLQIARCYDRLQEPKKALIWYERFMEKFPKHDKTSEIYWLRAWDLEASGGYEEAIEFYLRQIADFKANKRGDWANFRIGLCQYKAGNFAAALSAFKAVREQVNSNAYPAGLYWEAQAQEAMGDTVGSRPTLLELYRAYPFSFYGHLARQTLTAQGAWADSLEPWHRFTSSRPESIKAWMKGSMSGFSERLGSEFESDYLEIGKLLQFQLDTLAVLTLHTLPAKVKNNPWFLYVNSKKFRNRELWRESYHLGLQLSYKIPPDKWGTAPREVLQLIYPRPYEALVQKFSARRSLDPAFVYALIRQESGFDRDIKSGAGAVGLMQLMPATARNLAKKDGWSGFDPNMLNIAEANIRLGTMYLRDLKKDYDDNYCFVLTNYNAGPEATRRWLAALGSKPLASLVEDISYWETRDYVKKVMGNYWTYRILWNSRIRPVGRTAAR
jgi:soluble lytic murein transglycosylase-like protein/Tfp pilus assembly protein PilF